MKKIEVPMFVCEVCGNRYEDEDAAKKCESRGFPLVYNTGLVIQTRHFAYDGEDDRTFLLIYFNCVGHDSKHLCLEFGPNKAIPLGTTTFHGKIETRNLAKDSDSLDSCLRFAQTWGIIPYQLVDIEGNQQMDLLYDDEYFPEPKKQ